MGDTFYPLLAFSIAATISPGGATILATASGTQFGFRRSIPLILALASGLASLSALSALGLGALIATAPRLQFAMRAAGSAYLVFLAYRIATSGAPKAGEAGRPDPIGFASGYAILFLNPKAWMVALSASAAFSGATMTPQALALVLAVTLGTCVLVSLSLWCVGGFLLARTLRTDAQWRAVNLALSAALLASIAPLWA